MAEIIAYHGWGFDHTCWADWVEQWSGLEHRVQCFNRGYWGQPCYPQFSDHPGYSPRLLLLHSFGFHLCPLEIIKAADMIVVFNSFLQFHPNEPRLQRRSRRMVGQMSDRLKTHPDEVLQKFWSNCYASTQPPSSCLAYHLLRFTKLNPNPCFNLNPSLLNQDLEALNQTTVIRDSERVTAMRQATSVTVIHGESDRIVPVVQGATLADAVASSHWVTIPNAGHALPFSHSGLCWSIAPFNAL